MNIKRTVMGIEMYAEDLVKYDIKKLLDNLEPSITMMFDKMERNPNTVSVSTLVNMSEGLEHYEMHIILRKKRKAPKLELEITSIDAGD